ncbi:MAG: hypothetical protein DMG65_16485 [Candidatus Angelobacter sp. Gp1-AA117]|nr:MAG: hypothetical protein DMG65_16485 [Candidatus Angelobacter sp. Gp1-AA117]
MPNFLFWNVNRKPLGDLIVTAALELDVDVLVLAESTVDPAGLLIRLNHIKTQYFFIRNFCPRIQLYVRFNSEFLRLVDESERYSISRLKLPARAEILLVSAHLPSKREFTASSQAQECARLAYKIQVAEKAVGHQRTLFIGDLNVNPFEDGMILANAFHAVMTKETAMRPPRTIQGEKYSYFYNPMWSHFGDGHNGAPAGTYYYEKSEHLIYFWNIFDQVLLRPELAVRFKPEDLKIVSRIGKTSLLLPNGRPDSKVGSDHLPILLELEF